MQDTLRLAVDITTSLHPVYHVYNRLSLPSTFVPVTHPHSTPIAHNHGLYTLHTPFLLVPVYVSTSFCTALLVATSQNVPQCSCPFLKPNYHVGSSPHCGEA